MSDYKTWGGLAVITGGTKGMGVATAERVASFVDEVILNYRSDEEAALEAADRVIRAGSRVTLLRGDVGDPATFTKLDALLVQRASTVALLVHAAVDATPVDLFESDMSQIRRSVEANGTSLIMAARAVEPYVAAGSLAIFLSSKGAVETLDAYAGVGVPKAMAESATRYIARSWASRGARAVVLVPGAVDTASFRAAFANADDYLNLVRARTPLGRLATPEDVADAIVALRSEGMSMVTGVRFLLDGGMSLL